MNKFYITTAIPYVNGKPHIGHALEYFQADTIRNFHKVLGDETLLLSGADENALKNVQAAEKENVPVQEFLDRNSKVFEDTFKKLGIKLDVFQRGSDKKHHFPGVQKFWELCYKNGDIYKKSYTGLYCVGCESFKTAEELVDGLCQDHQTKPEETTEENYFFKLSKYQDQLVKIIETNELSITPENKKTEILSFIKAGLSDFSVSRPAERAKGVGVPVPNDPDQAMYVWFDALNIYMTGVGYGWDEEKWKKWWPANVHVIGKDINRFHTVYWPAMLLSSGIELPKQILIHSFIQSGGQKMSKTLGNVVDPFEMIDKYGLEPFRYYLLSQIPTDSDGDFTESRFAQVYTANLANRLGNLVARVAKLAQNCDVEINETIDKFEPNVADLLDEFNFNEALQFIWALIGIVDAEINRSKPWELEGDEAKIKIAELSHTILVIAYNLQPFLPETAEKILKQFSGKVKAGEPLFPRLLLK